MRLSLWASAFVLSSALLGCGSNPSTPPPSDEQLGAIRAKNMKAVADDRSLSDREAVKKYLGFFGTLKPAAFVAGSQEHVSIKDLTGVPSGTKLEVKVYDLTFFAKNTSTAENLYQYERDSIKQAVDFAVFALGGLKERNLKGISYQIFSKVEGQPDTEIFRATITQEHTTKLEAAAKETPDAGSSLDPRSAKINDIWKVEKNTYNQYTYKK